MRFHCHLAEWLECLAVNAKVATFLGSIPASSDTVESEGRKMEQCWKKIKKSKKSLLEKKIFSTQYFTFCITPSSALDHLRKTARTHYLDRQRGSGALLTLGSGSGIDFFPDGGSPISGTSGSQTHIFDSLMTNFEIKSTVNFLPVQK